MDPPNTALDGGASTSNIRQEANNQVANSALFEFLSTLSSSLKWCPTSEAELARAEAELLEYVSKPYKTYFVDIGPGWGKSCNPIRTLEICNTIEPHNNELNVNNDSILTKSSKCPLVLIHGFAAGIGTWILNYDTLATTVDRKIYAFDLIGFGRSSRAPFDLKGDVEGQFVDSIERWRKEQNIEKFIILGHSFGGYLSASYALRHPNRVSQLILADPWGIQDRRNPNRPTYRFPIWVRAVNSLFQNFNPLAILRVTGPYGPNLIRKFRSDLKEKFRPKMHDDCDKFLNYIYHCNAQNPTGESAFKALALPFGWPKDPLIHRMIDLDESVPITFIYGQRSWIEKAPGEYIRDCMVPGRVIVHSIQGSGHHVYADKFSLFNELVAEACRRVRD